ncbi:MAG: spore coat protein, partial [Sulfobacillus thermosulfidooxidans]
GNTPAMIVYFTTESYRPQDPDEKRLPWNDPTIDFDWRTQNR